MDFRRSSIWTVTDDRRSSTLERRSSALTRQYSTLTRRSSALTRHYSTLTGQYSARERQAALPEHEDPTSERDHSTSEHKYPSPESFTPDSFSETEKPYDEEIFGRIVGGKYAADESTAGRDENYGPLQVVDADIPLTLTELVCKPEADGDHVYVALNFADGDAQNPFNWPKMKKVGVSAMMCSMTLFIGLATTSYSSGIESMCEDFGVSILLGQLGLFMFNFVCAVVPLVLAPFCELVGRKTIYAGAYLCFSLCFIGLALGKNIATILVMRGILGLFGCVGTILVGGTFDDMYPAHQRGPPMAIYSYISILGTVGAPIYAGFIEQALGWRWIQGIQGLSNIPLLICVFLFFPETRGGAILGRRANKLHKVTGDSRYVAYDNLETPTWQAMLRESSIKAIYMLVTEPVVFAFGLWIGFCWFVTFLFLSVIPITFSEKRGWDQGVSGLPYIGLALGATLGWLAHHLQMRKYDQVRDDPARKITPEARLYGAMFGAPMLPVGLFIYSFTQYGDLPWIAPCIGLVLIAFGIFFVFESTYSFTADCYGENSSSAIAGQGLLRNTLGAVSPLFASQFFHNVGSQYAGLIMAIAGTALSLIPFVMFKWGSQLRAKSKKAIRY